MLRELISTYVPKTENEAADRRVMLRCIDTFPDILTRENEIAHFTASSWIVNPARTHVLMCFHNIYKHWSWTGGHADGEEDLKSVALREAAEETGIKDARLVSDEIYSLETITVPAHIKRGRFVPAHLHLNLTWLLEADDAQALTCKPDENSGVKWIPIGEVLSVANEAEMLPIYSKLNARLEQKP